MRPIFVSRRTFVGASAFAMAATAGVLRTGNALAATGLTSENEATVRKYYTLWETPDWRPFDALLADSFTFTSPNGDDHISKSDFKAQCWDTQKDFIARFDLLHVNGSGDGAFVMYDGFTKNQKKFRNVEFMRVKGGRVESIECYFGDRNSFASAVSAGTK